MFNCISGHYGTVCVDVMFLSGNLVLFYGAYDCTVGPLRRHFWCCGFLLLLMCWTLSRRF